MKNLHLWILLVAAVLMGTLPGTVSLWCNQNGDGPGFPGRVCC